MSTAAPATDVETGTPRGATVELQQLQARRYLVEIMPRSFNLARLQSSGRHRSRALGRGMEFEEVRLYQPGDDVRTIDWRVTARTQVTHTKRYRDEKEKPVITLVDQRRSLFFGSHHCFKSVYACHLAALISWSTVKRGDRAGGVVIGTRDIHEARPLRSHKGVNRWLQLLTGCNQQLELNTNHPEPAFATALEQLLRIAHTGTECVLISDCYDLDADCEALLFRLSRHNRVSLFWIVDRLEQHFPRIDNFCVGNGRQKTLLSTNNNTQERYHQQFLDRQQTILERCQRSAVNLFTARTDTPLTDLLKNPVRQSSNLSNPSNPSNRQGRL